MSTISTRYAWDEFIISKMMKINVSTEKMTICINKTSPGSSSNVYHNAINKTHKVPISARFISTTVSLAIDDDLLPMMMAFSRSAHFEIFNLLIP